MVPANLSQVGFLNSQLSLSGLARLLKPLGQQFAIGGRVQDLNIPKPIHSVLFAPDTLDFWVANADSQNVASHTHYRKFNLLELLQAQPAPRRETATR